MVENLLIIGNGFDLQCGLESSYKDFYEYRYHGENAVTRQRIEETITNTDGYDWKENH
jgi:hypothetical protein